MDYLKYPGLAEIEYHRAVIEAGDCLYLPYQWVHQVRSYNSNVAVAMLWDAYLPQDQDIDQCPDIFDPELTVDKVKMIGFPFHKRSTGSLRGYFLDWTEDKPMEFEELFDLFSSVMFHLLDENKDGILEQTEVQFATEEMWKVIMKQFVKDFEERLDAIETEWRNQNKQENMPKKQEL